MKLQCTIPNNLSALGILSRNSVQDGFDFRTDGYIYHEGKKLRKWFSSLGEASPDSKYFWKPCLDNLARVESVLYRLSLRQVGAWQRLEKLFKQIVSVSDPIQRYKQTTWVVHAKPTHCYDPSEDKNYWVFYLSDVDLYGKPGFSYSNNWVQEPKEKILPELGQQFYHLSWYHRNCCTRMGLARAILFEAIMKDMETKHGLYGKKCRIVQYVINNRNYWLREVLNRCGVPVFEWMQDPGGVITEIIL
jgi:hypothetical protein